MERTALAESPAPPNRLAELRRAKGLSQAALATELGLKSNVTVWRWEKNRMEISVKSLRQLCALFDCSVEHLLGWDREDAAA